MSLSTCEVVPEWLVTSGVAVNEEDSDGTLLMADFSLVSHIGNWVVAKREEKS